jgi:hypothetical protein
LLVSVKFSTGTNSPTLHQFLPALPYAPMHRSAYTKKLACLRTLTEVNDFAFNLA